MPTQPQEMVPSVRQQVKDFVSPLRDLVFWEPVDSRLPGKKDFAYGDPHWDSVRYPHHRLCHVTPSDESGWQRWYYVCDRANQDDYNFEIVNGEELVRTYVIPRNLYFARHEDNPNVVAGEFTHPDAGAASPDARFPQFCFADDTLRRADNPLDGLYVVVQRRFIEPVTVELVWNDDFQRHVRVTKEVIPAGEEGTFSQPVPGVSVEVRHGNAFHDVRITQELVLDDGDSASGSDSGDMLPYRLPDLPTYVDRNFPNKLVSATIMLVWTWADSTEAAQSYSEDMYIDWNMTEPRPGPYEARVLRYITGDPDAIRALHPMTVVPNPVRETLGMCRGWWSASNKGNRTTAIAREWEVPAAIHGEVTVTVAGKGAPKTTDVFLKDTLAATPNLGNFLNLSEAVVGFEPRRMPLGLYEVRVVVADISNLYS